MLGSVSFYSSNSQFAQWQSSGGGQQQTLSLASRSEKLLESAMSELQTPQDVIQKALNRAYAQMSAGFDSAGINSPAAAEFEPLSAQQAAGNILGFIERRLALDVAEGASQEQLASRLDAGLEGFKKGFAEAEEQLEALGMLNEHVAQDIGHTYDLVTNGIDQLRERFLTDLVQEQPEEETPVYDAGTLMASSSAYDFAQENTFSFSLTTADGDKVNITASAAEAYSAQRSSDENGRSQSISFSNNQHFSLSVEGELDEGELEAINDLLGQVNDLASDFFAGDYDQAFKEALDIGYDATEITGFALRLTHTEVQRFSEAYTPDRNNSNSANTFAERMQPIGRFAQQFLAALESSSALGQPNSFVSDLLAAVAEHQGEIAERLTQFTDQLQENLSA